MGLKPVWISASPPPRKRQGRLAVDLPDFRAREIVKEGGRRLGLIDLDESTRKRLFRELTDGRSLGEGPISEPSPDRCHKMKSSLPRRLAPWCVRSSHASVTRSVMAGR